jgi:hypothetical protein
MNETKVNERIFFYFLLIKLQCIEMSARKKKGLSYINKICIMKSEREKIEIENDIYVLILILIEVMYKIKQKKIKIFFSYKKCLFIFNTDINLFFLRAI